MKVVRQAVESANRNARHKYALMIKVYNQWGVLIKFDCTYSNQVPPGYEII